MATITAFESVTLDGVMQAPGRPDEDTRGGFRHGGWAAPYRDDVAGRFAAEEMSRGGALLFGRRTYDDLLGFWTTTPEPNPFTEVLVNTPKHVASRDHDLRLAYPNSTLLAGEASRTVAELRRTFDGAITVLGSGELVRALLGAKLVDELVLLRHPLVLGTGTRLFGSTRVEFGLQRTVPTTTGVIIAKYAVG
ncbi:dihydrofolate reductase family protein [Agromyces sp. H66]|uniref:dihydrofolate reductase family protein n=1 Tax=Agromyces sp. H66 TaxID=2529859 RepID=UPI0010AB01DC|nr:dihydrofolate reductase family protein [Agromyces sp. H66]